MKYVPYPVDDRMFKVGHVTFELSLDPSKRTTQERVVLMKSRKLLDLYDDLFDRLSVRNVVEFGIFEGGSSIYFGACKSLNKYVGIDLRSHSPFVLSHLKSLGLSDVVKLYYETSQADNAAIDKIVTNEFGGEPIDMVIDDASHLLGLSRTTFENNFPKLRPGGIYVLDDWGWAHWIGTYQEQMGQWHDQPALSNLVFEITMAMASEPQLISKIEIGAGAWLFITRGPGEMPAQDFKLSSIIRCRGRKLQEI